jgi:hypothetical protein
MNNIQITFRNRSTVAPSGTWICSFCVPIKVDLRQVSGFYPAAVQIFGILSLEVASASLSIKRWAGRPVCGRNRKHEQDGFLPFVGTAFTSGKRLRFVILPSHLSGGTQLSASVAVYGEALVVSVVTVADGNRHGIGRQRGDYQILADASTRTRRLWLQACSTKDWR